MVKWETIGDRVHVVRGVSFIPKSVWTMSTG